MRDAKYRDLVEIQQRPAATFQDLLNGLNDVRPHIIHFSGHGGDQTLMFDSGDIENASASCITFEILIKALDATDHPPTLLVMNACDTLEGAAIVLPAVPIIIGMSNSITDLVAIIFAQQFYAAVASGQSVGSALKQAKLSIEVSMVDKDCELPQLVAHDDVEVNSLVLVHPNT